MSSPESFAQSANKEPTAEEKEAYQKFQIAWDSLTEEEKKYMGDHYGQTGHADEVNKELENSSWEKLSAYGVEDSDQILDFLDKVTDPNYWSEADIAAFKKRREERK